MKLKMALVAVAIGLVLVSSFVGVAAESKEDTGSDELGFQKPTDTPNDDGPGAGPCGGGEGGGPNPF
jgi:hypothetical protein